MNIYVFIVDESTCNIIRIIWILGDIIMINDRLCANHTWRYNDYK